MRRLVTLAAVTVTAPVAAPPSLRSMRITRRGIHLEVTRWGAPSCPMARATARPAVRRKYRGRMWVRAPGTLRRNPMRRTSGGSRRSRLNVHLQAWRVR